MICTINRGFPKGTYKGRVELLRILDKRAGILPFVHDPRCILVRATPVTHLCANELPKLAFDGVKK